MFVPGLVLSDENLIKFFETIPTKLEVIVNGKQLTKEEVNALMAKYEAVE